MSVCPFDGDRRNRLTIITMSDIIAAFVHNASRTHHDQSGMAADNGPSNSFYLCSIRSSSVGAPAWRCTRLTTRACVHAAFYLFMYFSIFCSAQNCNRINAKCVEKFAVIESKRCAVQTNHRTDNNQWFISVEKLITRTGPWPEMSFQHTHIHCRIECKGKNGLVAPPTSTRIVQLAFNYYLHAAQLITRRFVGCHDRLRAIRLRPPVMARLWVFFFAVKV